MKKDDVIKEVLSAMKALEILTRLKIYLGKAGETVNRQDILNIINTDGNGDEDEYYTQPDY